MRVMLLSFLAFWLRAFLVNGVFVEEAFETDWHLESLGHYECVLESPEQGALIILSSIDSKTLVSLVNETNGQLLHRQLWGSKTSDAMMLPDSNHYLLRDYDGKISVFDSSSGLQTTTYDASNVEFVSACDPKLTDVKVTTHSLQVLEAESKLEVLRVNVSSTLDTVVFFSTDYSSIVKVLYSTTDGKYVYQSLKNNEMLKEWIREDLNGEVIAHTFINLIDGSLQTISEELATEDAFQNVWEAYVFRVTTNWGRLRETLRESGYSIGKVLTKLMKLDSDAFGADPDVVFGLAKLLVVATDRSVIEAFDVQNGKKVWRFDCGLKVVLLDYAEESNELRVFSKDGSYEIYDLSDAYSPQLKTQTSFDGGNVKSISSLKSNEFFVEFESGEEQVIFIGGDREKLGDTFITNHDSNGVYGHIVNKDGLLKETWKIELLDSEELVAFASRHEEPTATLGQTLGDRSVLYKYLYPNLAAYVTLNSQKGKMFVNLIDTVTGELLYSQSHDDKVDGDAPINIVFGEYWFVYSYFSAEPIPEQKLVTVELYESLEANKRVSNAVRKSNVLMRSHKPKVISAAYFFPEVIRRMTVSKGKFGITSKAIIMELESGQITYLAKEILSARRVEESKMTDDAKKEFMAMPYISTIPLNDQFIITHSRNLLMGQNSQLVSVATNLESTTIVCDIGHDIFCTKIYPSGQFDIMSPDFEKGKLLATIIGLVILCYFLRPSVEAAKLKKLWLVR